MKSITTKDIIKTITLEEAFKILENAAAIIIDDNQLLYPELEDLTGDDDNEFLSLRLDFEDYSLTFREGDNRKVEVSGCCLFLYDTNADDETCHTQITILVPKDDLEK